jgi:hypothetical protein
MMGWATRGEVDYGARQPTVAVVVIARRTGSDAPGWSEKTCSISGRLGRWRLEP